MYHSNSSTLQRHRDHLLGVAERMAEGRPLHMITRDALAAEAGVAAGIVSTAFGGMAAFRDALMRHAVERRVLHLIAAGIATQHPVAMAAPADLRMEALSAAHS